MDAYFVVGSEGSGTNMLEEAFVSAGCYRDPRHATFDFLDFSESESPLVFRRSLPHAGMWPDLRMCEALMREVGFVVHPIIIFREWNATVQSVLKRDPDRDEMTVERNMQRTIRAMGKLKDPIYITYEAFCLQTGFRQWLFDRFDLPEPLIEIKFANWQYYGGEI